MTVTPVYFTYSGFFGSSSLPSRTFAHRRDINLHIGMQTARYAIQSRNVMCIDDFMTSVPTPLLEQTFFYAVAQRNCIAAIHLAHKRRQKHSAADAPASAIIGVATTSNATSTKNT